MPPKKTKPNAHCPCGSGTKHKKCCMNAATSTVGASSSSPAILDEMMEELSSTIVATTTNAATATASDIRLCSHGCRSNHFQDGVAYKDVIPDCVSASKDLELRVKFAMDHMDYFSDLNFSQYIFALCTSWYLKTNQTPFEMRELLELTMEIKYVYKPIITAFAQQSSGGRPKPDADQIDQSISTRTLE